MQHKRTKGTNPLQAGILSFISIHQHTSCLKSEDIPKRFTRYGSLLLLGPTFPCQPQAWAHFYSSLTDTDKSDLYRTILEAFKDRTLTHVAINAAIAPMVQEYGVKAPNKLRSPTGLDPVFGDFGPGADQCDDHSPSLVDMQSAYWTQVSQVKTIVQVWAPRWTMFSRGNVSEKARIMQNGMSQSPFPGLSEVELGHTIDNTDVVDFYVGIGYFAFCYLARGVARVWGWEINGWSVEGLRRGCIKNGWAIRVVEVGENGALQNSQTIEALVAEINRLHDTTNAIRCVVFQGDNKWAHQILSEIKSCMTEASGSNLLNIRHCNLGLLPSSEHSWGGAVRVLDPETGGWLHVHENVQVSAIDVKREDIVDKLRQIANSMGQYSWSVICDHVEQVKTYAPGVVHCVYDVKLFPLQ